MHNISPEFIEKSENNLTTSKQTFCLRMLPMSLLLEEF